MMNSLLKDMLAQKFYWLRHRWRFIGRNIYVARGSYLAKNVKIGAFTRINHPSHIGNCDIGACCAIAGRLIVRDSNHSTNRINMQADFHSNILKMNSNVAGFSKGTVTIGNGVWIGDSVIILSGVKVGDGAVIGAGAVVTKSVPPFSIAVGNPARVIRYRFPPEVISLVSPVKYWEWSIEKMKSNRDFFECDLANTSLNRLEKIIAEIDKI